MRTTQDCTTAPPSDPPAAIARRSGPDRELLELWDRYCELIVLGRGLHDGAFDLISDEMAAIEDKLMTMTATTVEGVAVLLRVGLLRSSYSDELAIRYVSGRTAGPVPAGLDPVAWRAVVSLERQIARFNGPPAAKSRRAVPSRSGAH